MDNYCSVSCDEFKKGRILEEYGLFAELICSLKIWDHTLLA